MTEFQIRVLPSIADVPAVAWDACANASAPFPKPISEHPNSLHEAASVSVRPYNPFVSHAFLWSLERSQSVGPRTGWAPQHLVLESKAGDILGTVPCYLKSHSQGEYVFDHGWAEAYERAGGRYYPKLQVSVPFTPATGPRLLVPPGPQAAAAKAALAQGLIALCGTRQASSVHATFLSDEDCSVLSRAGFLKRTDKQFHWANAGYGTFEDFLSVLASRKRKLIRRERRDALANGITIHRLTGSELTEDVWDAFFRFYMDTGSRKWGRPYLTRAFYSLAGESMADRILLVMARRAGRWIAGAINFIGSDALYGRHWGAIEEHPFLHFEVCYYQAIDYAIAHKLPRVEAGAQGEHKLARGYVPVTTVSAHYLADPGLRRAVADYLARERQYVAAEQAELAAFAPFRKTASGE